MNTIIRKLGLALSISAACVIAPATGAFAQDTGMTLDQLLQRVKQGRVEENKINAQREAEFKRNRNNQAALLAKAEQDVRNEEAESKRLEGIVASNKEEIARLTQLLQEALGEFNELVGVVKQVSGDTRAVFTTSLISSQYPGRDEVIGAIAEKETIPTSKDLNELWAALHGEMTYQGQVARYAATVSSGDGSPEEIEVVRVGPFDAIRAGGDFLKYEEGKLSNLGKQPTNSKYNSAAAKLFKADPGQIVSGTVDPSRGSILGTFVFTPSIMDRVKQGGTVGYAIIALGVIAVLLGVARIFALWSTGGAVRRQAKNSKASKSNPLGRIMLAYEDNKGADVETLELKLDEAIMKEVPKLERGLNLLKVIAAVAPMMGLLGTVTGMILTFQAIQIYGAGDPQMMAGGISQALMTTVLGLVVAIPVLLLHSFASGMSTGVTQVLEEQSVGIVARHAEGS